MNTGFRSPILLRWNITVPRQTPMPRRCIYEHTSARARVHTLYFQPQSWFTSRPESRNSRSL